MVKFFSNICSDALYNPYNDLTILIWNIQNSNSDPLLEYRTNVFGTQILIVIETLLILHMFSQPWMRKLQKWKEFSLEIFS